jgi:ATP-dependent Clp protease ATP-binding subunit ClpA
MPFSAETKRVLQFAAEEADRRHDHIDTEHLLLGIFSEPDARAAKVLVALGVALDRIRDEIVQSTDD